MLTSETLMDHSIPLQETFDRVVKGLTEQNQKCEISEGSCAYRGYGNTKCAAGFLIEDEDYTENMEGEVVCSTSLSGIDKVEYILRPHYHYVAGNYIHDKGHFIPLVRDLQIVHDSYPVESWKTKFQEVADKWGCNYERT